MQRRQPHQFAGAHLRDMVIQAALLAGTGALFGGTTTAWDYLAEQALIAAFLTHQASTIAAMLARADHAAMPAALRPERHFMPANLSEPIARSDIARAAGVNVRSLQIAFQQVFGKSPIQVLRDTRLDAAHCQLSQHDMAASVTDAAFSSGFSHLGRLSRDFKARFGYLPSQAARRQQHARPPRFGHHGD